MNRKPVLQSTAALALFLAVLIAFGPVVTHVPAAVALAGLVAFLSWTVHSDAEAGAARHGLAKASLARLRALADDRARQIVDLEGEQADLIRRLRLVDGAGVFQAIAEDMPNPVRTWEPEDDFAGLARSLAHFGEGRAIAKLDVELIVRPAGRPAPAIRRVFPVRTRSTDPDRNVWDTMRAARRAQVYLAGILEQAAKAAETRQAVDAATVGRLVIGDRTPEDSTP